MGSLMIFLKMGLVCHKIHCNSLLLHEALHLCVAAIHRFCPVVRVKSLKEKSTDDTDWRIRFMEYVYVLLNK